MSAALVAVASLGGGAVVVLAGLFLARRAARQEPSGREPR